MKIKLLTTLIILISIITTVLWVFSKQNYSIINANPLRSLGQVTSLIGIVLLSGAFFLSLKSIFIDKLFGGLDKVLKVHRIIGGIGLILLINHPLFFVAEDLPNLQLAGLYLFPSNDLGYLLGIAGLYLMILSFICLIFLKLPFHIWKLTHQVLGLSFLSGFIHTLVITSDISRYLPLKVWVIGWVAIGIGSFIYNLLIFPYFGPRHLFKVHKIERLLDIINIYLSPLGNNFKFNPGQFIYLSFKSKVISGEKHPFSISSSPEDPHLRVSVKISGDYTLKLPALTEGVEAIVFGPYGSFGKEVFKSSNAQIWIAGGIGAAPFLSLVRSIRSRHHNCPTSLFYIHRNPEEMAYISEVGELIKDTPNLKVYTWCSKHQGRFSVDMVKPFIEDISATSVFICGPTPMMKSLKKQFGEMGVSQNKIYTEDFAFL